MKNANLLLACSSVDLRAGIEAALEPEKDNYAIEVQDPGRWTDVIEGLREKQPDVLMLELGPVLTRLADTLRDVKACTPRTKVIALHTSTDPDSILSALRSGAHEFIHPPWKETVRPALDRVMSMDVPEARERRGKVIGFLSAKGGCGATTIACHVASDLARQTRKKVLLADMDFASGMVGFAMKVQTTYSAVDAIHNLTRLDESLWRALVVESKPGLDVLPAPASNTRDTYVSKDELIELVRFMRTQHDWVVLDLGRSLNRIASDLYEQFDQLVLVSVLEVTALHGLKAIIRLLTEKGEDLGKLQLVINRTPKMMDMSAEDLAKILGRPLYAMLPNDYPSLYRAYSTGTLLASDNRLAQHFSTLTSKISGVRPTSKKKKFSLFG